MPKATIRRSVVVLLVIVALAITVWSAVAQAGPTPTPTATPTAVPSAPPRSVVGWGSNHGLYSVYYGQATPPDTVNGVLGTATDIAAGGWHTLAIVAAPGPTATPTATATATPIPTATPTPTNGRCMNAELCEPIPCPAQNACISDSDCPSGATCVDLSPEGPPSACFCNEGIWVCTADISRQCVAADCLCEVTSINPNQVVLQNVGTGGKGSDTARKMVMTFHAMDAPGATCDPGEFSAPTPVNLKMEDDRGNILIDSAKTVVCEQGATTNVKRNVFFRGPLNCENGALPPPKPDFSLGAITSTGSAPGAADYVESTKIKCFE